MNDPLLRYQQDLILRGFSKATIYNYSLALKSFIKYCDRPLDDIDLALIKQYLVYMIQDRKLSNSAVRIAHGAIRYFFSQTLSRPLNIENIPQMIKQTKLPAVLSFDEVRRILASATNLKHKALLTLVYSSGLRVSESVKIKSVDIIRDKMRLRVTQAKGGKDRFTVLSARCLELLEKYWRAYRPQKWLFPGRNHAEPLSTRACQHAFELALKKSGIGKTCGIHTLRHSFATHTLETGGGIFQLQKLLGHKHLKTTLVYVHLQEEKIVIRSPLDIYAEQLDS
jgi:integrase/recombinase XerD